jgi:hypothetical protein
MDTDKMIFGRGGDTLVFESGVLLLSAFRIYLFSPVVNRSIPGEILVGAGGWRL